MAVEDKFFIPYIERNVSKPFSNLKPDEQIIAHWALVYKELIKFNYSSLIGCDLDSPMTEKQMKGLSSDKKGGIDWYNYMYSEQYKDDEKLRKDGIKVDGKDPNYWARLSIFEALERYCVTAGDWPGVVCLLGKWYEKNIHTYQGDAPGINTGAHTGRKFYDCPLFKSKLALNGVGDDCTSFCFACIQLYWDLCMKNKDEDVHKELIECNWPPTSIIWGDRNQQAAKNMEKYGFEILDYSPTELQPWDMVMGSKAVGASHGHGEIYVGPYNGKIVEFGWGSVHDGQGRSGMPAGTSYKEGEYSLIFRMKGIKKMNQDEVEKIISKYK